MTGRLEGKVVVLTGGGGAIGSATAAALAAEGARVAVADVAADRAADVAARLVADGADAEGFAVDVADDASVAALYAAAAARFGAIHALANLAGNVEAGDSDLVETPLDVWQRALAVHLTGTFLCCRHGLPHLLAAGGGAIVNMGSMVALVGSATPQIAYCAAKGGIVAMTREIAVTYARRGIRANVVCPGPIDSPLLRGLFDEAAAARRLVHSPSGRFGRPEEIAAAIVHLASDESSWTNGASLVVDGGITVAYTTPE